MYKAVPAGTSPAVDWLYRRDPPGAEASDTGGDRELFRGGEDEEWK